MKRLPAAFILFLLTGLTPVAFAQTTVPAAGTTITAAGSTAYTSSEGGVLTMNLGGGTQTGALTGNLGLVVNLSGNQNTNRLILSGTNDFSGGLTISTGTVLANQVSAGTGDITLTNNGTWMVNGTTMLANTQKVLIDGAGALRAGSALTVNGQVTSKEGTSGDLLIHCDGNTVTLSNTNNNYTGVTNIGGYNVSGSGNTKATLRLGASNVLPDTTIVQIGKTRGTVNANTVLANSELQLNGMSDTVAGLEGAGKVTNSGNTSFLTVNLASDANYTLSGAVTGSGATTGAGLNAAGSGALTLSGALTYAALQVNDTATLTINNTQTSLHSLSVGSNATLNAADTGSALALTISGNVRSSLAGTINAASVTLTHTGEGTLRLGKEYSNMTINMSNGGFVLDAGTTDWREGSTFTYHGATVTLSGAGGIDVNGNSFAFDVLPDYSIYNTGANSTITVGNDTVDGTFTGKFSSGPNRLTITKTGSNTQTIAGTYNASATDLNINGGKVVLAKTAANTAFSTATINSGGTLEIANNGTQQQISGLLTIKSGGTLNINGGDLRVGSIAGDGKLDLGGNNLTVQGNSSVEITNSAAGVSLLTVAPTSALSSAMTFSNLITGNTRLVVNLSANASNSNRVVLSNSNNTFTGGVEIQRGTLRVDDFACMGTLPNNTIDFNGGSLMTNVATVDKTLNLMSSGALRATGNGTTFSGQITGVGSLEIVNDSTVTLSNTSNNYKGNTLIGVNGFRSDGLTFDATLKLGASGVLPDTTVVQFGGGTVTGAAVLNINGVSETVTGIKGVSNSQITGGGTLTLNTSGATDNNFAGNILGGTNLVVSGTGVQTLSGDNSAMGTVTVSGGTLNVSGAKSLKSGATVSGGTLYAASDDAFTRKTIHLTGGTLSAASITGLNNAGAIHGQSGSSTILIPMSVTNSSELGYKRELFSSPDLVKVDSYYQYSGGFTSAATLVSNIDSIVNFALGSGGYNADAWGSKASDQSNTNLLQTTIVNVTDSAISLDFARCFHNDAMLVITDSEGAEVGKMDWATVGNGSVAAKDSAATGVTPVRGTPLTVTLEPGEEYTLEMRLSRFNKTIGATDGGVNKDTANPIGLGVKVAGSTDKYLALNIDSATGQWAFGDGSFLVGNAQIEGTFSNNLTVDARAEVTLQGDLSGTIFYTGAYSGTGTIQFDSAFKTGAKAVFSGTAEGSLKIADGLTFTTSGDSVTVAGNLNLGENAMYLISGDSGKISTGSITGTGDIIVDMDSLNWGADSISGTWITLTGAAADSDLSAISISLLTDNPGDYRDKTLKLFDGIEIPESVMNSLLGADSMWIASALANGQGLQISFNSAAVPEPSTGLLLLVGLGGLIWLRSRRKTPGAAA